MAVERPVNEKKLRYMEFVSRETGRYHHTHAEDMYQYELLQAGDMRAIEESKHMFYSENVGHLSDDPVRNIKYLFVSATTLACRAAIGGGMVTERAYNISDLYIQKMDALRTVEEVLALHIDMITFYTKEMAELDKKRVYSKPVILCMDYIYNHLHEPISIQDMAEQVNLSASYLSTLFKKEAGCSVLEYILSKRMEAARNMLKYSDYSYADIGAILAFSSQSHFIRVFKKETGYTPKEYRDKFFHS
ncbi:MAG: AraC family transcriptional regulator [Clostridium sp.]|nr:AraC family transcriptional regulator [Clostridium sp.]